MKTLNLDPYPRARAEAPLYDIVLIHPFSSAKARLGDYRDALNTLLREVANKEEAGDANIYRCSFDGTDVVSGRTSISTLSTKLLAQLKKVRPLPADENARDSSTEASKEVSRIPSPDGDGLTSPAAGDTAQKRRPLLLFIAHSLGCWVAKSVLSQNKEPAVSIFDTVGLILLDAPEWSEEKHYNDYACKLWSILYEERRPGTNSSNKRCPELAGALESIDKTYRLLGSDYIRQERRKHQQSESLVTVHFDVWIPNIEAPSSEKNTRDPTRIISWIANQRVLGHILTAQSAQKREKGDRIRSALEKLHVDDEVARLLCPLPTQRGDAVPGDASQAPPRTNHPDLQLRSGSPYHSSTSDESRRSSILLGAMDTSIARINSFPARWQSRRSDSLQSVATRLSDNDRASIASNPTILAVHGPDGMPDETICLTLDLGKSFLKKGELKSAETAFIRGQVMLQNLQHPHKILYDAEIRAQLAGIQLHSGMYMQAFSDFGAVLALMERVEFSERQRAVIERWIAVSRLYQGEYAEAKTCFEVLLKGVIQDQDSIESGIVETTLRRDLALASAYLGNYHKALQEMDAAHTRLRKCVRRNDTFPQELATDTNTVPAMVATDTTKPDAVPPDSVAEAKTNLPKRQADTATSVDVKKIRNNLRAKRDLLYLTESKINFMWGDFKAALKDAEKALSGMKKRWGAKHIKTLECASHHAILLAFNSRISEAETACSATLQATRKDLGSQHPNTLETMGHLVYIYKMQSRLVEAGDTAQSLAKNTKASLSENHPQTLRSRGLLAEVQLALGDYVSGAKELEETVEVAIQTYREKHPDTLRYRSLLALAYYHRGKLNQAEAVAVQVLEDQRQIYTISTSGGKLPEIPRRRLGSAASSRNTLSARQGDLHDLLEKIIEAIKEDAADLRIHPCLLQTLRTIGLIAQQKGDQKCLLLAQRIFSTIWERHKTHLKDSSAFILDAEYDLALAYREGAESSESDNGLEQAAEHLRHVYQERLYLLGSKDPSTLSARRELITTNCTLDRWEDQEDLSKTLYAQDSEAKGPHETDVIKSQDKGAEQRKGPGLIEPLDDRTWCLVEGESLDIFHKHEGQVGEHHPETLKSLLWLLTVQVLLRKDKDAEETFLQGLQRFRHESVRGERLFESLNMEQKLALVLSELGPKQELKVLECLHDISHTIRTSPELKGDTARGPLHVLRKSTEDEIMRMVPHVQANNREREGDLRAQIKSAEETGNYGDALVSLDEFWKLQGALYGYDSAQALDTRIQWAELKSRGDDARATKEAHDALDEMNTKYASALNQGHRDRIGRIASTSKRD